MLALMMDIGPSSSAKDYEQVSKKKMKKQMVDSAEDLVNDNDFIEEK